MRKAARIPIPGRSRPTSKNQVIPPITSPSNAAYVHISIGLVDPEKITIKATIKPPNAPTKISGPLSGIEKAVNSAVVAVIRRRSPVFSATPSIVIMLDSYPSHQGASL